MKATLHYTEISKPPTTDPVLAVCIDSNGKVVKKLMMSYDAESGLWSVENVFVKWTPDYWVQIEEGR